MAFFDNFSKKVQDVAFVATEKAQQVAAVAGEKANAVADKAKTEYEMASERRSMDKNYRAIGEWYVSTLEGGRYLRGHQGLSGEARRLRGRQG